MNSVRDFCLSELYIEFTKFCLVRTNSFVHQTENSQGLLYILNHVETLKIGSRLTKYDEVFCLSL